MRLRERMRSEVWRHTVVGTLVVVLAIVANIIARLTLDGQPLDANSAQIGAILAGAGCYGPLYLVLSRYAWRGLRGKELRDSLRATRPPTSRLVRNLLIGGPTNWSMFAAIMSLAAVIVLAVSTQLTNQSYLIVACLLCVTGSWVLVVASFSVAYAREWAQTSGFSFPDQDETTRSFGDFIYTAVQVSTTYSSSDVGVINQRARRLVTVNAITAFAFSTVIIALLVALVLSTVI